ncbi:transposase family protein [Streptomyces sp. NPDC058682]|uniref:transposase family protein n=1 Tax=Streptomyces sp. NPDC058682 TaxID=3346596 RepID=UPI00364C7EBE
MMLHQVAACRCCGRLWTVMVLVMLTDAPFWDSMVFEGIGEVDVEAVTAAFGTVEVVARGRAAGAACPDCGRFSDRVHDRYQRRLKDLPLAEQGFVIRLTVRRFICGAADCPRRTFAEPFSRLAAPHARFTTRLNRALERVGSRWPGGPALGWLPSWASARDG